MTDLNNKKNVIITGASSGIGTAIAVELSQNYNIIAVDKNDCSLNSVDFYITDLSNQESVIDLAGQLLEKYNRINGIVNCAGIFCFKNRSGIEQLDFNELEKIIQNNLFSNLFVTKYMLPLLKNAVGNKFIINISSDQSFYPRVKDFSYALSKSAISMTTRLVAKELEKYNIRVNEIAPASVRTGFLDNVFDRDTLDEIFRKEFENYSFGEILPSDIAKSVRFLADETSKCITGQTIIIDSGKYL